MTTRVARRFGVVSRVLGRGISPADRRGCRPAPASTVSSVERRRSARRRSARGPAPARRRRGSRPRASSRSVRPSRAAAPDRPTPSSKRSTPRRSSARPACSRRPAPSATCRPATADARCRAWLERLALRAGRSRARGDARADVPDDARLLVRPHAVARARARRRLDGATVVVDTGHLWWDPRLVEQFRAHVADIGTVQLTNISSGALDRLRYPRAPFDDGEVPLRALVRAFDAAGYTRLVRARGVDERARRSCGLRPRLAGVVRRDLE